MRTRASILSLHPSICEKNGIKLNHSIRKVCFQLNHESEMETHKYTYYDKPFSILSLLAFLVFVKFIIFQNNKSICACRPQICFNPSRPSPGRKEKINLNFRFYTSLWCLERFYEGLNKTFWGTAKKCENKNLS